MFILVSSVRTSVGTTEKTKIVEPNQIRHFDVNKPAYDKIYYVWWNEEKRWVQAVIIRIAGEIFRRTFFEILRYF